MLSVKKARANKQRYIEMKGGKCHDCGGTFYQCCFHFDHRDPAQKLFSISDRMHWDYERMREELGKCDLVCANCHALRTFIHKREAISKKQGDGQRGKKRSAEVRARMSEAQRGHILSIESRQKLSASRMGQVNTPSGWHHTQEAKDKISVAAMGNHRRRDSVRRVSA